MPQAPRTLPASPGARRVVYLHALAPAKPATGAPCNGCGLCCAAEPCPLGMLLSRRRRGVCAALRWSPRERRYLCGALAEPALWLPWLPRSWARGLVRRWIAAGVACDADLTSEHAAKSRAD
jgi:hypothetical protein